MTSRALAIALVVAVVTAAVVTLVTAVPAVAQPSPPPAPADGFDVDAADLLLALGIAALIGAAGGYVYGGITGRRRRRRDDGRS